ncbi:MAG: riboflavin biosynthesis protein RibF [Candidatus Eisenbacteria bacterium]|nr:riboflavin biosynthesis protein RibF [Candidatus Latescibacterota bacterium]MBD3303457.1 riboflavin biosynthesis protein RibF [Candidatus Eisenbacteria bacterium]
MVPPVPKGSCGWNVSSEWLPFADPFVATIGVFDGLHRGHEAILGPMLAEARRRDLPSVLFTFRPRPVTVFAPETPPDELTPPPRKWRLLAERGVDRVIVLRFSAAFARVEAARFARTVLGADSLLRAIWVGYDFRFGHRRQGDFALLQRLGGRYGFPTHRIEAIQEEGEPISSSRIRRLVREGEIEAAARLLGRWPDLEGRVVSGRGQGAKVLVPTANLDVPPTQCLPAIGVYAGQAEHGGEWVPAVMNLGTRPTLTEGERIVPEVHLLGRSTELRGRSLLFRIRARLRGERKFPDLNALRRQVEADIRETERRAAGWKEADSGLA